jgi:hypothetical protein
VTHLAATLEAPMNDAVHQLLQLVLQAITWAFKTIEALWVWSWVQIAALFLPVVGRLGGLEAGARSDRRRHLDRDSCRADRARLGALARIMLAIRTTVVTLSVLLALVVVAALFSRGFQWIVTTVPDRFWESAA